MHFSLHYDVLRNTKTMLKQSDLHLRNIHVSIIAHGVCAAQFLAVSTSRSALNVVLLARASQGAAVSQTAAPGYMQQMFRSKG